MILLIIVMFLCRHIYIYIIRCGPGGQPDCTCSSRTRRWRCRTSRWAREPMWSVQAVAKTGSGSTGSGLSRKRNAGTASNLGGNQWGLLSSKPEERFNGRRGTTRAMGKDGLSPVSKRLYYNLHQVWGKSWSLSKRPRRSEKWMKFCKNTGGPYRMKQNKPSRTWAWVSRSRRRSQIWMRYWWCISVNYLLTSRPRWKE